MNEELVGLEVFVARMKILLTMYTMGYRVAQVEAGVKEFPQLQDFPGWIDNFAEWLELQSDNEQFIKGVYKAADDLLLQRDEEAKEEDKGEAHEE